MAKLISIITASKYKEKLSGLFDNLELTASDMDSFEVLVKVDDDHQEMIDFLETEKRLRPFLMRYIATPRLDGYWSIYIALNDLLKIALEETYFIWAPNDEIRFATKHWDAIVRKYCGLFPDDVFYLRISGNRHRDCSLVDCCALAEHLGFFTKKWLHLTEGFGRGAVDTGNEFVNFYLRNKCGQQRSVPIDDIEILNIEEAVSAGHGLSEKEWEEKLRKIYKLYIKLLTKGSQENIYRRAQKLNAYIWARAVGLSDFQIRDDRSAKKILIKKNSQYSALNSFSYKLSISDWLKDIVDSINIDKQTYFRWPPLLAIFMQTRRNFAEHFIGTPVTQFEMADLDDLDNTHNILYDIFKNRFGFKNELLKLTEAEKGLVDELVEFITSDCYFPSEAVFVDELLANLSNGALGPPAFRYLSAANLYGYIL